MSLVPLKKRTRLSDLSNDSTKKHSRFTGLVCLVCGGPATGFNFSVITCMCCKAFFRRNALYGLEAYQCRYSTEKCVINIRTRRDCSYCRLHKCFQVGMKKELILTEEIKQIRREKLHANRQLILQPITPRSLLKEEDVIYLRNIYNAYEEYCRLPIMNFEKREYEAVCHQPLKSRLKFQHYAESFYIHKTALEGFFKCVPEFQQFSTEEQKALTTTNLRLFMRINSTETMNDSIPIWGAIHDLLEIIYGKTLIDEIYHCLQQFKHHLNDSKCIQLLLIILLFSNSSGQLNTLALFKIQEKYTELLWIYLKDHFGERIACQKLSLIIRYCLHIQAIGYAIDVKRQQTEWPEYFISIQ